MTTTKRKYNKKNTQTIEFIGDGKMQPQAIDLEDGVLGAILLDSNCIDTVIKDLTEELFYKPQNQVVMRCLLEMYHAGIRIDLLTVSQHLKTTNSLELAGGSFYVSSLTNRIASSANIEIHIKILQQQALKRSIIQVCSQTITDAYKDETDVFDVVSEHQARVDESVKGILHYDVDTVGKVFMESIHESRKIVASGLKSGVETGLILLDNVTSGFQKSDLIILAGRPGMGKTSIAVQFVEHPAVHLGVPVAFFSLEMSKMQVVRRMMAGMSNINVSRVVKNQIDAGDVDYMEKACELLLKAPMYIDDTPAITLTELKSKARRLHREKGIQLIVIDYLQLMRSGLNIQNREQEVAEISKGLKVLAKELDIPVIALSQLSRQVENRAGGQNIPKLSDLRETGQIEQDADMVMFCYRPEYYGNETYEIEGQEISTDGLFMLLIEKHRNGELGEIPLRFVHNLTKVKNHERYSPSPQQPAYTTINSHTESSAGGMQVNTSFLSEKTTPTQSLSEYIPPPPVYTENKDEDNDDLPF